jgi:hypothetical protein
VPSDVDNVAELARLKLPATSFYLLRPDGYVALCGAQLDLAALARHAAGPLGLRTLPLG